MKVKCIHDPSGASIHMTVGNIYQVIEKVGNILYIIDNQNRRWSVLEKWFEEIPDKFVGSNLDIVW